MGSRAHCEKMKECVWLRPEVVARIEFLEWTGANHLRHTKFIGLRDDKDSFEGGQGNIAWPCAGVRQRPTPMVAQCRSVA